MTKLKLKQAERDGPSVVVLGGFPTAIGGFVLVFIKWSSKSHQILIKIITKLRLGGSVLVFISTPITLINITIERYSSSSKPSANHHHLILIKMVIKWSSNHHLSKTGTAMTATSTKWLESLMTLMPTAGDLFVMDGVHGVWAWWCSWWFFLNLCLSIGEVVSSKYNFEDDDSFPMTGDCKMLKILVFCIFVFMFPYWWITSGDSDYHNLHTGLFRFAPMTGACELLICANCWRSWCSFSMLLMFPS